MYIVRRLKRFWTCFGHFNRAHVSRIGHMCPAWMCGVNRSSKIGMPKKNLHSNIRDWVWKTTVEAGTAMVTDLNKEWISAEMGYETASPSHLAEACSVRFFHCSFSRLSCFSHNLASCNSLVSYSLCE